MKKVGLRGRNGLVFPIHRKLWKKPGHPQMRGQVKAQCLSFKDLTWLNISGISFLIMKI